MHVSVGGLEEMQKVSFSMTGLPAVIVPTDPVVGPLIWFIIIIIIVEPILVISYLIHRPFTAP